MRQICPTILLFGAVLAQPALASYVEDESAIDSIGDIQDETASDTKNESTKFDVQASKPRSFYDLTRRGPLALELQLAPVGSPIGHAGIAADVSVFPALGLYAGVGMGGYGVQWAVGARPRLAIDTNTALTTTLAFSRGEFQSTDWSFFGDHIWFVDMGKTSWVNADVGPEYRADSGFLFRCSIGYSQAVHSEHPAGIYHSGVFTPSSMPGMVYLALAVGFHAPTP